jgi:glycolate oxidase FAD binding subunit
VPLASLAERLASLGLRSRLDPLHAGATVGGAIAADPVGPEYSLDRRLRGDVLGLQVALTNGALTRCGGRVVKNVTGFDLVRLYCGSLGTLGVIAEATVRLRAAPAARCALQRGLASLELAVQTAAALLAAGVAALAGAAIRPRAGGRAELLWLLEGHPAAVERAGSRFGGDPAELSSWEEVRESVAQPPADTAALRISARPSDTLAICRELTSRAGSGALRAALPEAGVVFARLDEAGVAPLIEMAASRGWAVFVERASAALRRRIDVFGPPPQGLALMREIKRRFDPQRCLAPGKFAGRI